MKLSATIEAIYSHVQALGFTVKNVDCIEVDAEAGAMCDWKNRTIELTPSCDEALFLHEALHVAQFYNNKRSALGRFPQQDIFEEAISYVEASSMYSHLNTFQIQREYEAYALQFWFMEEPEAALAWLDFQLGRIYA